MKSLVATTQVLKEELSLQRDFASQEEAALLSYLFTSQCMDKLAYDFFSSHGLSDAQFNVLILLSDLRNRKVQQWELAGMLLVNRASIGGLITRMMKKGLIARSDDPEDRRAYCVSLTKKGTDVLNQVKEPYYGLLKKAFAGFSRLDQERFTNYLNMFRKGVISLHSDIKKRRAPKRNGQQEKL